MNLVKRDDFDALKKMVQKLIIENEKLNKKISKSGISKKNIRKKATKTKKTKKT